MQLKIIVRILSIDPKVDKAIAPPTKYTTKKGAATVAAPFPLLIRKNRTSVLQLDRLSLHRFQPLNAKDTCSLADRLC